MPNSSPASITQDDHSCTTRATHQVVMHIVRICEAEAAALLAATEQTGNQIKEAISATQPQSEDSGEEEEGVSSPGGSPRIDAVRAYFEEHHKRKADDADNANRAEGHAFIPGRLLACLFDCAVGVLNQCFDW